MDAAVPWRVRDAALLFALGVVALALSLVAALGLYRLQGAPGALPPQPPPALAAMATDLFYVAILAGAWLLVVRRYETGWASLGLRLPDRHALGPTVALFAVFAVSTVAVMAATIWALQRLGLPARVTPLSGVPSPSDPLFPMVMLGAVVLTPIAEEVLYRGVLYQSLRKHVGAVSGTVASAVLFTVAHFPPAVAPELLVFGIVLAVAFERTRSLYPSMLMHAAYNAVIILLGLRVI